MSFRSGSYRIGPSTGHLRLLTTRDGLAARVGHDLTISVDDWSGVIEIRDAATPVASVTVTIRLASMIVLAGTGGVAPLSASDRRDIRDTALRLLDAASYPEAGFAAPDVPVADQGRLPGTLTLRGVPSPVTLDVARADGDTWTASATVRQTDFGITPYRAFFGALKLADAVTIAASVTLRTEA